MFTSNVVKKSQFLLNTKIIEEKMKYLKKKKKNFTIVDQRTLDKPKASKNGVLFKSTALSTSSVEIFLRRIMALVVSRAAVIKERRKLGMETEILLNPPRWNIQGICKYSYSAPDEWITRCNGRLSVSPPPPITSINIFSFPRLPLIHFTTFICQTTSWRNEASKSTVSLLVSPTNTYNFSILVRNKKDIHPLYN